MFDVDVNLILKIKLKRDVSDKMRDTCEMFVTKNTDLIFFT
jgi:hypothetical protein